MTTSYRVFFRHNSDIVGREDFEAEDDATAMVMASLLCDACSDVCERFELWQGVRRVDTSVRARPKASVEELTEERQRALVRHEEILRDGRWAISASKRLLGQIGRLRH